MTVIFLTTAGGGQTWTVPADWNDSANTIEAIGGGGGSSGNDGVVQGNGGGGAEYRILSNVSAVSLGGIGTAVPYSIGTGGAGGGGTAGTAGGDTNFNTGTLIAKGGGGVPAFVNSGGAGGSGGTG